MRETKNIYAFVEKASSFGGFSPKPPIGGRLRPPNPLQNYCSVFC
ncbi:hypothetical protein FDUTEX481_01311 [Tolypothrix sp. PCC 7601]|nr:hypothetical protein FDUTEX481_01311 [Tolypothrix sp. PCC 7601]